MITPRFSIITITFNSEKTVERTLKSVLAQSYTDFEYIIVDGASKDSTMEIVRKYEPLFEGRMKVKSEPDKGIYDAMNKGILRSVGTIVGIVNSDDWLEPDALENVNHAFEKNNNDVSTLYCGGIIFHYDNGEQQKLMPDLNRLEKMSKIYVMGGIRHPATFVPKSIYDKYGVFDEEIRMAADQDLILRLYFAGVKFLPINKVLSNMADGGLSNLTSFGLSKIASHDRWLILSKFDLTKIQRFYYYQITNVREMAKFILKRIGAYKTK